MTFRKYYIALFSFLQLSFLTAHAQTAITGPTCVTHNVEYQYNLTGSRDTGSRVEICITGGMIMGENKTCFSGRPLSFIRVRWNENIRSGTITIKSTRGIVALNVSITPLLKGGNVDPASSFQIIKYNTIPNTIVGSNASGGSCTPTYAYTWEQSPNGVTWNLAPNGGTTNLKITTPLKVSSYYRRKVTETTTRSIAYSAVVTIIVKEPSRNN